MAVCSVCNVYSLYFLSLTLIVMTSSTEASEELFVDYDFAQQEIMQQAHDPIQESIEAIERQYEDDKQGEITIYM